MPETLLSAKCHLPLIRPGIWLSFHPQTLSDVQGTELMAAYPRCSIAETRFNLLFRVLKCLSGNPDTNGVRLRQARVRLVGLRGEARVSP